MIGPLPIGVETQAGNILGTMTTPFILCQMPLIPDPILRTHQQGGVQDM